MKKIYLTVMLFCLFSITALGDSLPVELHDVINVSVEDRSEIYDASAVLDRQRSLVEVSLYKIGEATISILNSRNYVVNSVVVNTDLPVTEVLNVPSASGRYYIVVYSTSFYAVGEYEI